MKRWIAPLIAMAMVVGLMSGNALAAKKDKKKDKGSANAGQIDNISGSGTDLTLTISVGKGKKADKKTITTNKDTSVTVDGQAKTVADLKSGLYVKLDSTTGVVKTIDASTTAPAGKDKKNKKKKNA